MTQVNFGMVLRDARERKGYDLTNAARRLRIRPDILQAIEDSDFSRIPPRGYARNMVNAYARYLGLNPTEITRMYLDDCYAYQVGRARSGSRQTGFDMSGAPGGKRGSELRHPSDERGQRSNALGRALYVDDPHGDRRRDGGAGTGRTGRALSAERPHRTNREALPSTQYTNFYSGPKSASADASKIPFIIAGAVILVLVIIVLVLLFGPKGGSTGEEVPKVPVSGLTDPADSGTGGTTDTADPQNTPVPVKVAPAKTTVKISVAAGQTPWVEVQVDGVYVLAEQVTGPAEKSYDVTGVIKVVISGDATLTQDGVAVPLDFGTAGVANVTIDFAEVLAAWKLENETAAPADTTTTPPAGASGTSGGTPVTDGQ